MTDEEFIDFAVSAASGLKFTYHTENEDNGSVTVWVNELALSVNAETKDQCMADILDSRRPLQVYEFSRRHIRRGNARKILGA